MNHDALNLLALLVITHLPLLYGAVLCPSEKPMRRLIAHDSGESATTIAATLGVSRATVYRVLSGDIES
jgi:DNA-binding protein Fis